MHSLTTYPRQVSNQNINKLKSHSNNMEKDIGKIKKNENTDIVIRIDDFGGKTGLTIREYTTSERYTGFTKSGTRISAESFKDFKALINSIDEKDIEPSEPTGEEKIEDMDSDKVEKPEKPKKTRKKKELKEPKEPSQEELALA